MSEFDVYLFDRRALAIVSLKISVILISRAGHLKIEISRLDFYFYWSWNFLMNMRVFMKYVIVWCEP